MSKAYITRRLKPKIKCFIYKTNQISSLQNDRNGAFIPLSA